MDNARALDVFYIFQREEGWRYLAQVDVSPIFPEEDDKSEEPEKEEPKSQCGKKIKSAPVIDNCFIIFYKMNLCG